MISKEELEAFKRNADRMTKDIKDFTPLVEDMLASFKDIEFIINVCKANIEDKLYKAKEGDIFLECSLINNQRYFDKMNKYKQTENEPLIDVNVAGIIKFAVLCPKAGTNLCRLRDFTFINKEEQRKEI